MNLKQIIIIGVIFLALIHPVNAAFISSPNITLKNIFKADSTTNIEVISAPDGSGGYLFYSTGLHQSPVTVTIPKSKIKKLSRSMKLIHVDDSGHRKIQYTTPVDKGSDVEFTIELSSTCVGCFTGTATKTVIGATNGSWLNYSNPLNASYGTVNFTNSFDSGSWTDVGTLINVSNGSLNFVGQRTTIDNHSSRYIGNQTDFNLSFDVVLTESLSGGGTVRLGIAGDGSNPSQDFIGINVYGGTDYYTFKCVLGSCNWTNTIVTPATFPNLLRVTMWKNGTTVFINMTTNRSAEILSTVWSSGTNFNNLSTFFVGNDVSSDHEMYIKGYTDNWNLTFTAPINIHDNFYTDQWTDVGTLINVSDGRLNFGGWRTIGDIRSYRLVGDNTGDFNFSFKTVVNSIKGTSGTIQLFLSDSGTSITPNATGLSIYGNEYYSATVGDAGGACGYQGMNILGSGYPDTTITTVWRNGSSIFVHTELEGHSETYSEYLCSTTNMGNLNYFLVRNTPGDNIDSTVTGYTDDWNLTVTAPINIHDTFLNTAPMVWIHPEGHPISENKTGNGIITINATLTEGISVQNIQLFSTVEPFNATATIMFTKNTTTEIETVSNGWYYYNGSFLAGENTTSGSINLTAINAEFLASAIKGTPSFTSNNANFAVQYNYPYINISTGALSDTFTNTYNISIQYYTPMPNPIVNLTNTKSTTWIRWSWEANNS